MAIAIIDKWLSGSRNYDEGLKLFEGFSKNTFLKKLLADGEDEYNANRLASELKKLSDAGVNRVKPKQEVQPLESIPNPFEAAKVKVPVKDPVAPDVRFNAEDFKDLTFDPVTSPGFAPIEVSKLPEELQRKAALKSQLWKKICYLHSQLLVLKSDEERKEAAFLITSTADKIQEIFDEIDYFQEHGFVRPTTGKYDIMKMSPRQLLSRRNTVRTYISKAKKGTIEVTIDKLNDWKRELDLIDKRLEELENSAYA